MRNRSGLRTAPCGTPAWGVNGVEMAELTLTLMWRLLRKLEMMDWVGLGSLRLVSSNLYMRPLCHTLSNAFSMSKNIARVICFLLMPVRGRAAQVKGRLRT